MPDAMRAGGLSLLATPRSLVVRPATSGHIEFQLRDEQGQPVPNYPIDFSLVAESGEAGGVPARLSTDRSLTDANGSTVLQVISDGLGANDRSVRFFVQATCQGADEARVDVTVTTNPGSVQILPIPAPGLISAGTLAKTLIFFYDNSTCSELDLANLASAPTTPLAPPPVDPGASWTFLGVSEHGSHAVVGLGYDANNVVRIAGCLDLAGKSLLENPAITATLLMDHLLPFPIGSYQVVSEIGLAQPVPQAVAAIEAAWQEWARCPFDPARLWLDCTIDALATAPDDPNDCVPVSGAEGPLGVQLDARRGDVVSPIVTTPSKFPTTTCHDRVDPTGSASLEAIVDLLFQAPTTRGQLSAFKLDSIPSEIGTLLSSIRMRSTMRIAAGVQPNSYTIDHEITDLGFPVAVPAVWFEVAQLGLPVTGAHGLSAALKTDQILQIQIPRHGFTLRLGTAARFAFEGGGLKVRGADDAMSLVSKVFALANLYDRGTLLTGCDALDAALSDRLDQPRGSLLDACRAGLESLARKLSDAFGNLDGDDLDFFFLRGTGSVPLAAGLWKAETISAVGSYSVNGFWSAQSAPAGSP
jgi:hypothetical protein